MKLILTSQGIKTPAIAEAVRSMLPQSPTEGRALVISHDAQPEHVIFIEQVKRELFDLGFKDVVVFDLSTGNPVTIAPPFDLVYVCGGNTFHILDKMRRHGIDKLLVQLAKAGAVYLGVSAGSIIAGPDITISDWGSEGDPNDIKLTNLEGLHLTETIVFPHFRPELANEVDDFRKQTGKNVVTLTDEEALVVEGQTERVI